MPIFYRSYDANTGEEIIFFTVPTQQMVQNIKTGRFIRAYRGETLGPNERLITTKARNQGMVRDYETKRFIRGIKGVSIQVALLFKYPPEEARKKNPLYVDIKLVSFVTPDILEQFNLDYEDIERELGEGARVLLTFWFNEDVSELAEIVGVEHTADITTEVYTEYHYYVVWHHYKNDEQEQDGSGTIGQLPSG